MPDNFSADDPQSGVEPVENAETQSANGTSADDFDIDLGTYTAREDDLDINLDFGDDTDKTGEDEDDLDLDFGAPPPATTDTEELEEEDEAEVDAGQTALENFRTELRSKPGDWYVVHTYSGMEKRVKHNLENRIISLNMEDYIHEIVVPTEEVAEIKNGSASRSSAPSSRATSWSGWT